MTTVTFIIMAGAGLIALMLLLRIVIAWRRRNRQQIGLDRAFDRARLVARTGSGLQGKPYSLYGKSSWSEDSRH